MSRLINEDDVIEQIDDWLNSVGYCTIGKGLSYYGELIGCIQDAPTVDAVSVVRCKDCIYYHKAHAEKDGVEYDYSEMPREAFDTFQVGVTLEYGINVGGKCEYEKNCGYDVDKSVYRNENDFCSRGERKEYES